MAENVIQYSAYQSRYFANYLTKEGLREDEALTQSLSSARVDLNPHQVDAAMFALRSPLSKGVLLADEVGLGKTIEAALVLSQRWWEQRRNLLLIVPASLRKQWATELREKFSLPSIILDAKKLKDIIAAGQPNPIGRREGIIILSYEYAARIADVLQVVPWDLVVFDEAHKLRNVYKAPEHSRAAVLRSALAQRQKLLLTATPLQNNLMELYGLVTILRLLAGAKTRPYSSQPCVIRHMPEVTTYVISMHEHVRRYAQIDLRRLLPYRCVQIQGCRILGNGITTTRSRWSSATSAATFARTVL